MLQTEAPGKYYHDATRHSYQSVLIDPNYVDPFTQPTAFKIYPKFYRRFPLEVANPIHQLIRLTSTITFKKHYKEGPYQLRVIPSAGALFPTEVYVQLRGVRGLIDGIYHLEPETDSLTLIYELIDDGIESYLFADRLVKGMIFLVSCVYYRSSWKYQNRSLRYCLLDSGHHLGAIEAGSILHNTAIEVLFDFDQVALNRDLGFENKEFVTACMIAGDIKAKTVKRLRSPLPFVSGTDYFEANPFIESGYQATLVPPSKTQSLQQPQFHPNSERWLQAILNRRSARRFKQQSLSQVDFLAILQCLQQPIPTTSFESITIYLVIHHVEGWEPGLYQLGAEVRLLKSGDFREKAGYLCISQAIARDSAVTLFFTADYQNYQTAVQLAGFLGQRLYLWSEYFSIGCTGIGAYYDEETQAFLETEEDVLYAMAIGL